MSLRDVKACMEALQEKIDHLEDGTLHRCCECDDPIKSGDKDAPWCNKCGSPAHCDGCGGDIVQGLCSDCVKEAVEKAATVELPRCGECDEKIKSHGYCPHCHRQEIVAAKTCAVTRYPHVGVPRTGAMPDQILTFLTVLVETCGCRSAARRCVQCDDATYLRELYRNSLGEVRT